MDVEIGKGIYINAIFVALRCIIQKGRERLFISNATFIFRVQNSTVPVYLYLLNY